MDIEVYNIYKKQDKRLESTKMKKQIKVITITPTEKEKII